MIDYEIRSILEPPAISKSSPGRGRLPIISGYAAVFNSLSETLRDKGKTFREIVRPGAFLRSIADAAMGKGEVFGRFDHSGFLGRTSNGTVRLREDTHGLRYEIDTPDTQFGRDLLELIRRGDVRGSSFGFRAIRDNFRPDKTGLLRELHEVSLIDVSPVTIPAYSATSTKSWSDGHASVMAMKLELAEAVK